MEEKDTSPRDNDAFSSMLSGILSNPEMMSMVSTMAEQLKNGSAARSEEKAEESPPTRAETVSAPAGKDLSSAISALAPLISGGFGASSKADNDRACLLRALKPYLSEGRCEAIEYIIKFSKITDVIKNLS